MFCTWRAVVARRLSRPLVFKAAPLNPKKKPPPTASSEPVAEVLPKAYDLSKFDNLISLVRDEADEKVIKSTFSNHLNSLLTSHKITNAQIVLLFDAHNQIGQHHSNRIYNAVARQAINERLLMVLLSDGGKIEPAYLISKACKRLSSGNFQVCVPRRAKSAATLIALGASQIHMGLLSELGPIDPQINGFPALGLANALEKIASLSVKFPAASDMFAKYITENLNIRHLGYFERINESAVQYAQRLIEGKTLPDGKSSTEIADHFTNHTRIMPLS
jgi:ClpP class serine protease